MLCTLIFCPSPVFRTEDLDLLSVARQSVYYDNITVLDPTVLNSKKIFGFIQKVDYVLVCAVSLAMNSYYDSSLLR